MFLISYDPLKIRENLIYEEALEKTLGHGEKVYDGNCYSIRESTLEETLG